MSYDTEELIDHIRDLTAKVDELNNDSLILTLPIKDTANAFDEIEYLALAITHLYRVIHALPIYGPVYGDCEWSHELTCILGKIGRDLEERAEEIKSRSMEAG